MGYSMPRPITSCKIGRREPCSGFPQYPDYGEYDYADFPQYPDYGEYDYADYPHGGELEIREDCRSGAWTKTRRLIFQSNQPPRSIEEHCGLHLVQLQARARIDDLMARAAGLLCQCDTKQTQRRHRMVRLQPAGHRQAR